MTILDSHYTSASSRSIQTNRQLSKELKRPAYKNVGVKIFLAVLLQVTVLLGFAAKREYTINTGTVVTLQAQTYDPFDPFRGDYVNLRYDMSSLPEAERNDYRHDEEFYAILREHHPYWKLVGISRNKPELAGSEIMLKGKVGNNGMLHYGIEQFFVPEGNGKVLEQSKHLIVEIAVDKTGCAMVKSVVPE